MFLPEHLEISKIKISRLIKLTIRLNRQSMKISLLEEDKKVMQGISLPDILDETVIALDVRAADWQEAIRVAGNLLVNVSAVKQGYVDSMVRRVREAGPYIVIAPGLAVPHALPQDGVNRVCLSMARLREPVMFGSRANDPIDLVIALGAIDEQAHVRILAELWDIFSDETAMAYLRSCRNKSALITFIRECAKKSAEQLRD